MADKILTLSERLDFAQRRVIAFSHVRDTYERQMKEIAEEREKLDRRERLLLEGMRQVRDGIVDRCQREAEELNRKIQQLRDDKLCGRGPGPSSKKRLERKRERFDKVLAEIQRLKQSAKLTDEEVEVFLEYLEASS